MSSSASAPAVPRSVGIIMDGNRRFARERGLSAIKGHQAGYEKLKEVVDWALEANVRHLTVFAFSTENWNRSKEEVDYLLNIIENLVDADTKKLQEKMVEVRFVGQMERFGKLEEKLKGTVASAPQAPKLTLWIALSYGGRAEILAGVNKLLAEKREAPVTEEEFSKTLWTAGLPDPDLIIRTSGEQRLSGFLTWAGVYSELFFTKTYWPAFTKEEFLSILEAYEARQRRMGR